MITSGVFKDERIQQEIKSKGYAVVRLVEDGVVQELMDFYSTLDNTAKKGTHVTMFNPSYEYRKKVDNKIKELCAATAEGLMNGYRVLYTNFMVKEPGMEGNFPLHQDWTYVDENQFSSYAFWIPLSDVNDTNGALHVVNGSHRFITALRGPYVHEPFSGISETIKEKYSTPVNLRAGEALIWDHRLIHFSKPNNTNTPRIAFTLIMVPNTAPIIHCFGVDRSETGQIEVYNVDTDFFMHYTISKRPTGVTLAKQVEQPRKDFDLEEFSKVYTNQA